MQTLHEALRTNIHVPSRCIKTHDKSVFVFETILNSHNIPFQPTKGWEDISDHIDYHVTLNNVRFTVDVKSAKKFFEHPDIDIIDERIWIEFKNVRGQLGWLYGKADYIAYVFLSEIWFLRRKKLLKFMEEKTEDVIVTDKTQALYKKYRRYGRDDLVTEVPIEDIRKALLPPIVKIRS